MCETPESVYYFSLIEAVGGIRWNICRGDRFLIQIRIINQYLDQVFLVRITQYLDASFST